MPKFVEFLPNEIEWMMTMRSTNPQDYQALRQSIGAMSKDFADGTYLAPHSHDRDQLLYATTGIMRLQTDQDAWIVPRNGAVYIPDGVNHAITMHGQVHMRTLYIDRKVRPLGNEDMRVILVAPLLRELILSLVSEPVEYDPHGRAGLIADLIISEIFRAEELSLNVPLPEDRRLQKLCAALLADPSDNRSLERWADVSGASARTMARLFENDLGMGFSQWRQRVRFHAAMEALSTGQAVSTVARDHGYNSISAFSSAFHKVMGVKPSEVGAAR